MLFSKLNVFCTLIIYLKFVATSESDSFTPPQNDQIEYVRSVNATPQLNSAFLNAPGVKSHDNFKDCGGVFKDCGGVFKAFQTVITTPNYPNNYPSNILCEYIFKSPYVCNSEFHVQFLDFALETSANCVKDRLCVGNSEALCGQVIGTKVYNSTNGILQMVFRSDQTLESKGFRLLVTRQPCQNEELKMKKSHKLEMPYYNDLGSPRPWVQKHPVDTFKIFKENQFNNSKQYLPPNQGSITGGNQGYEPPYNMFPATTPYFPAVFPIYICFPQQFDSFPGDRPTPNIPPNVIPYPWQQPQFPHTPSQIPPQTFNPLGTNPTQYPNFNTFGRQPINPSPTNFNNVNFPPLPRPTKIEPQVSPLLPNTIPSCCSTSFAERQFYLSSPNFPGANTNPVDCLFYVEKSGPNTCRLRIELKFFAMGAVSQLGCFEDFLEIDGQRICGCRTGLIYTSQWGLGAKVLRVKTSGKPNGGFLIHMVQEDCPYRYLGNAAIKKRIDKPTQKAIVERNSTTSTLYTFYGPNKTFSENQLAADDSFTEGPTSQFLFGSFGGNSCSFTLTDWIKLSVDPFWIRRPRCS